MQPYEEKSRRTPSEAAVSALAPEKGPFDGFPLSDTPFHFFSLLARRTVRARRRPGEATVERQLRTPRGKIEVPSYSLLSTTCNLTPL